MVVNRARKEEKAGYTSGWACFTLWLWLITHLRGFLCEHRGKVLQCVLITHHKCLLTYLSPLTAQLVTVDGYPTLSLALLHVSLPTVQVLAHSVV